MPIPIVRKLIARRVVMRIPPHLLALTAHGLARTAARALEYSIVIEHLGGLMARSNGRWGRLRRVLNEDLSSSTPAYTGADIDRTPGDTPRYGAGANIENHPQITDYIPRRFRITALILSGGGALGLMAEVIALYAGSLSSLLGVSPAELTLSLSNRLVSWTTAVVLIIAVAYARIVYLLKRHRLDDLGGRYRVWRQAGLLAILLSANSITSAHTLGAHAAGHLTNVHPFGSDAIWWLLPTALIGGWVAVRLILDSAECRLAMTSFVLAAIAFTGAAAYAAGWSPLASPIATESLVRILPLAGCLLALAGTLLTARYVVLDVQGLIEHPAVETKATAARLAANSHEEADEEVTAWTDGREPDDDYSDDDRPLTKAERKRLKKQQGRYRAA
jgi:hypothetical protein